MEHHRLKPMKEGYDEQLFNKLYKETASLRKKLAFEIDSRKFGVDYKEILSWFDVKFIFVFNKYYDQDPERLLGYIINALQTYKYRIMRSSYTKKYNNTINIKDEDLSRIEDIEDEKEVDHRDELINIAMGYIKKHLSDNALMVLEIELNPPSYIEREMEFLEKKAGAQIPNNLIAEYLGFGDSPRAAKYIGELRREAKEVIRMAKNHFMENPSDLLRVVA
jgi:hypothetical protein